MMPRTRGVPVELPISATACYSRHNRADRHVVDTVGAGFVKNLYVGTMCRRDRRSFRFVTQFVS